jgi:hypothetical protein
LDERHQVPNSHRLEIAVRRFPTVAIMMIEVAANYSNFAAFERNMWSRPLRQETVEAVALLESNNKPFKSNKGADGGEYQALDSINKDN